VIRGIEDGGLPPLDLFLADDRFTAPFRSFRVWPVIAAWRCNCRYRPLETLATCSYREAPQSPLVARGILKRTGGPCDSALDVRLLTLLNDR
jgi:hypothetical protein